MHHLTRAAATVALASCLFVTGCGGGTSTESATTAASTGAAASGASAAATGATSGAAAAPTTVVAKATSTTMAASSAAAKTDTSTGLCLQSSGITASIAKAGAANPAADAGPADLKTSIESLNAMFATMAKDAPAEIKTDVATVAAAYTAYASVLVKYDYDISKVARDQAALQSLQVLTDPKFERATDNIQAWVTKNCGVAAGK